MKYLYYKSEKGNFGDDLNPWLWGFFFGPNNEYDSNVLLGIGSILYNEFPLIEALKDEKHKIVFGSGIRPSYKTFNIDSSWDVKFLRGPLSAAALSNNRFKYIADAAYAIRLVEGFELLKNAEKKYDVGFMPYFKSVKYFDWKKLCGELGFRFISPYSEHGVEYTMKEIASSRVIITEAMHGAIIADALRVPWSRYVLTTPFTEGLMVSEFKWMDWLHSIDLGSTDVTFIDFYKKTFLNKHVMKLTSEKINPEFLFKSNVKNNILKTLKAIDKFYLSKDKDIAIIDEKLHSEINLLKLQVSQY